MKALYKIILESISQALQQLRGNKLRSFLSLLGISIGIFCVIGVFAGVDSLKTYIKNNMERLGNDVIYVQKWPFVDPGIKWWEVMKYPQPNYDDYEAIKTKVKNQALTSYYVVIGAKTLKYQSSSVERTILIGITDEASEMFNFEYNKGRFSSGPQKLLNGSGN